MACISSTYTLGYSAVFNVRISLFCAGGLAAPAIAAATSAAVSLAGGGFARLSYTTLLMFLVLSCAGGLAAPAIAAGIGAAISLAGGGAAAAAGASGFLATTAGAAAVMSSMGVAGGSYAGAHMARRIGEISPLSRIYK